MKVIKTSLEKIKLGTFFTFDSQVLDLFIKIPNGMMRMPNKHYPFPGMTWDNKYYENTEFIILNKKEIWQRLSSYGKLIS